MRIAEILILVTFFSPDIHFSLADMNELPAAIVTVFLRLAQESVQLLSGIIADTDEEDSASSEDLCVDFFAVLVVAVPYLVSKRCTSEHRELRVICINLYASTTRDTSLSAIQHTK